MGNLQAESNLSSKNLEQKYEKLLGYTDDSYTSAVDSGKYSNFTRDKAGYGLAQWTYHSRKRALLNYIKSKGLSIGSIEGQLGFLNEELSKSYPSVLKELKNADSVRRASDTFLFKFERPADQSTKVQVKRANMGNNYYNRFAKSGGIGGEDIPITIDSDTMNRFSESVRQRHYVKRGIGGDNSSVSIPDKVYEVLDRIVTSLLDIANNTKSTSEGVSKIKTIESKTAIVNAPTNNTSNNPIYSAATDNHSKTNNKHYTIAKSIAAGVQ